MEQEHELLLSVPEDRRPAFSLALQLAGVTADNFNAFVRKEKGYPTADDNRKVHAALQSVLKDDDVKPREFLKRINYIADRIVDLDPTAMKLLTEAGATHHHHRQQLCTHRHRQQFPRFFFFPHPFTHLRRPYRRRRRRQFSLAGLSLL